MSKHKPHRPQTSAREVAGAAIPAVVKKLTFSEMTWDILEERYGIIEQSRRILFADVQPVEPSALLTGVIDRALRTKLSNERAKSNRLVDPVLAELEARRPGQISTVPELLLEVKGVDGLCGMPDFVISAGITTKVIPIVTIIEAKKDDIDSGLPQCVAELYASFLLNGQRPPRLYGCVTTGREWQFLCLDAAEKRATVEFSPYLINDLSALLGTLFLIVDSSLAALGRE